ncbi:alpha 1,2-mannosyltransferase, glycosyltransferase family 71 protein [Pseudohyphozyma bogoriensis]|nr:alpha 1,2-mannosyltransferase, glycosyltransferase family 71 protein [Pseudohyphozyma bogoriensis]
MSRPSINPYLKEYLLPTSTSSSRSTTLTPRRLFVPLLLGSIAILGLVSLRYSSTSEGERSLWSTSAKSKASAEVGGWKAREPVSFEGVGAPLKVDASVEDRLRSWENAPVGEVADWVQHSIKTCPSHRISPNQNRQQLDQSHLLWSSINSTMVHDLRSTMIGVLRKANNEGKMSEGAWGSGRGLVFTAGNADTFSRVLLSMKMLHNHLKSPLPAEVFSFPGEVPSDEVRAELEKYGVTLRVVEDATRDTKRTKNYHIKATAIIQSRFREVLYLDSDNIPGAGLAAANDVFVSGESENKTEEWGDPIGLWEAKAYQRLGVMFWPDYWRTSADNPIWAIIGVQCRDEWEQEAGQILIDKSKHLDALLLSEWMMDSTRFKFWFNFSDGDKDVFRYAFLALRKRWGVPGRYVAGGMFPRPTASGPCAHTMLQHDHRGRPLFVHANLLKQIPSGIGKGFAWGLSRSVRAFSNTFKHNDQPPPDADLEDYDIDCDQLANAGNDGRAISPAGPAVRRRAALEKGIRTFFHGGWISALCVDMRWEDPRTELEIAQAKAAASGTPDDPSDDADIDVSFTSSDDGLEIKFESPLMMLQWADDVRLKGFEDAYVSPVDSSRLGVSRLTLLPGLRAVDYDDNYRFFQEGGHLNAAGFA